MPFPAPSPRARLRAKEGGPLRRRAGDALAGAVAAAAGTLAGLFCLHVLGWNALPLFSMFFLVGAVVAAVLRGRAAASVAVLLSMASYDLLFETPRYTLSVENWPDFLVFTGFLGIALLVATLVHRLRGAEEARREAELEQARATLLAAVSHDFRTPLATIVGAAATLAGEGEALPAEERLDLANLIASESTRLQHLVGNLLELMRLEGGAIRPALQLQPLEEVVGSVLGRLEPVLGPVAVDLPEDLPAVPLDGAIVDLLLGNLLENAFRHGGGQVRLRAWAGAGEVVVAVEDAGEGVPQGLRKRVFEKFYRKRGGSQDGGVGLGLAICQAAVRLHRGRLWVEDAEGGGASFRFTLPLQEAP